MRRLPVIAIFDIGKTNKKLLLFNEQYQPVYEFSTRFDEIQDEDGFPCEDIDHLRLSVFDLLKKALAKNEVEVKAVNYAAYGASLVYLDENGTATAPLYNYLKPFPAEITGQFCHAYGSLEKLSLETASPVLGNLNAAMQLYRISKEKPAVFSRTRYALHLPQYLGYLVSGCFFSDLTSIGCHTMLWDFQKNCYHSWVKQEGFDEKLAPLQHCKHTVDANFSGSSFKSGIGVHDSSAALIPYLVNFHEPFILLSTGTWCISLNPFNNEPLTTEELKKDCLCYLSFEGRPVKASRLFAGHEHEQQLKRIAGHFQQQPEKFKTLLFDPVVAASLRRAEQEEAYETPVHTSVFDRRDLNDFESDTVAYHRLMMDIIAMQKRSTLLVLDKGKKTKRIFVDGGFSHNNIYMNLLASSFPGMEVYGASMAQASALGAALAIHSSWNKYAMPNDIIEFKFYAAMQLNEL